MKNFNIFSKFLQYFFDGFYNFVLYAESKLEFIFKFIFSNFKQRYVSSKNFIVKSFDKNAKKLDEFMVLVEKIDALSEKFAKLSDEDLKMKTTYFKQRLAIGDSLDSLLVEAFATVREAAKRTIGLYHYKVQLLGGIALHNGMMTEMKTGEGKTLVATLAAYLNALTGKSVHVATVNDYLAKRDADEMGRIYKFLGLTCNALLENMNSNQRRSVYESDIVYVTSSQLGFDYLKDNMVYDPKKLVMRDLYFVIIDEADKLIDDGRTPLIISNPGEIKGDIYGWVSDIVLGFNKEHYVADEKMKNVILTEDGIAYFESVLVKEGVIKEGETVYGSDHLEIIHALNQCLNAHFLYRKDIDYIVKNGEVLLIDEMTGRILDGRRLSEGLHQAIEAKEKVEIHNESLTSASISYQKFFCLYEKISGMSGTCVSEADEFKVIYGVDTIAIPTHKAVIREDLDDRIYMTFEEKLDAIVKEVKEAHEKHQPILLITGSVAYSDIFSAHFSKIGLKHRVLNARFHKEEAEIIAEAGMPGAITIATNMAGRGTDIQLGGNLDMHVRKLREKGLSEVEIDGRLSEIKKEISKNREISLKAGGLYVIGTERNESRRVDDQARGRSGRQGDIGKSVFFLSFDDDLMRKFGNAKAMQAWAPMLGVEKGEEIKHPRFTKAVENAQKSIEANNFDSRKHMFKYDEVLSNQLDMVYFYRRKFLFEIELKEQFYSMVNEILKNLEVLYKEDKNAYFEKINDIFEIKATDFTGGFELDKKKILEKAAKRESDVESSQMKMVFLSSIDELWEKHLTNLGYLRQVTNLRSYAQKDPLTEYKKDGYALFEQFLQDFYILSTQRIFKEKDEAAPVFSEKMWQDFFTKLDEFKD